MRRSDLAVTQPEKLDEIIRGCDCVRLAFADGNTPYLVPVSFGYTREGEVRKFYFHSADAGKKVDLCRKLGYAAFELDTNRTVKASDQACNFSMAYQSVVGAGRVQELTSREEKAAGLRVIMQQYAGKADWDFPAAALDKTCVFCLTVEEISGRAHS